MFNDLHDPNVSLAVNFLDACVTIDHMYRPKNSRSKGLGPDVTNENFQDNTMSSTLYLMNALRNEGYRGIYKSLPFLYRYHLERVDKLPELWLSVRMFSLSPKFMANRKKKVQNTRDLVPPFMMGVRTRALAEERYQSAGGNRGLVGRPISFVPDIDFYWLGQDAVDLFFHIKSGLIDLLDEVFFGMEIDVLKLDGGIYKAMDSLLKQKKYNQIVLMFLTQYFPSRLREVVGDAYDLPDDPVRQAQAIGDQNYVLMSNLYTLFRYGTVACYSWLAQLNVT